MSHVPATGPASTSGISHEGDEPHASALPRPLTSFIGRDDDIAAVLAMLQRDDVRLVTLTGPGGVGKSRLALRIAESAEVGAGDVWFVPLSTITDPTLVGARIVAATGAAVDGAPDAMSILVRTLQDRRALLILDNFEQVLDAVPLVAALLESCPGLKVIATSRSSLNVSAEHVYPVPLLPLPTAAERLTLDVVRASAAVQLFIERARARRHEFALTEHNAADIARLCARLDGLPLGIELAAARISALSPRELVDRLDARLALLGDGARDKPGRLRSLRASIAWSYDLLPPAEQRLFRRLGVFAGPWTLEAAEAVVYGPDENQPAPVMNGIAGLIDKNLVRHELTPAGASQYRLLETIREFAAETLEASEDADQVHNRLAIYLRHISIESDFSLFRPDGSAMYRRLAMHASDIGRSVNRLEERGDADGMIELTGQIGVARQEWSAGRNIREALERAIALGRETESPVLWRGLLALGSVVHLEGDETLAWEIMQEAIALIQHRGDTPYLFQAMAVRGLICQRSDAVAEATTYQRRALAMIRAMPDIPWRPYAESTVLGHLGNNAVALGAIAAAKAYFTDAIKIQVDLGHEPGTSHYAASHAIAGLGDVARGEHDQVGAIDRYQHALRLARDTFDYRATVYAIGGIAGALACIGQWQEAARLFGAAEHLHRRGHLDFDLETWDRQRGLGLPEPWFRADASCGSGRQIRDALWGKAPPPFPPIPDIAAADARWAEGAAMSLEEAVDLALAVTIGASESTERAAHGLSAREVEVLRLLTEGLTDTEIAGALYISRRTAATHIRHIYDKLGVSTRAAAAAWAVRNGIA